MNILLLTPQLPFPPHQGTSLRNYYVMRGLAERHTLTLLTFLEANQSLAPERIQPLLDVCPRIETVPVPPRSTAVRLRQLLTTRRPDMAHRLNSAEFAHKLRHLLTNGRYDVVQIEGIELASYMDIVRQVSPDSRLVFDNHNAETELQRRNLQTDRRNPRRWAAAAYSWVQVGRLERLERWACQTADAVTAVSDTDKLLLTALAPGVRITTIPNCIDVSLYELPAAPDAPRYDLVFSGKMDYRPNVDAVLWFADAVWPLIVQQRPSATWAIVGQKPHARLERLRQVPGITLTGWVESVRPYMAGAGVFIMPFRVGSGTRLKLIEAMAAGKAIVSTSVGAEGFPVQPGRELLVADEAVGLATAVLQLLTDESAAEQLGQAAQQFARQYDWRVVTPLFDQVYAVMDGNRSTVTGNR